MTAIELAEKLRPEPTEYKPEELKMWLDEALGITREEQPEPQPVIKIRKKREKK